MGQFEDFLIDSFEETEEIEKEITLGKKKRKMKFRSISAEKGDEIRKKSRNISFIKGQKIAETNQDKYTANLIIETTVCPDLKNAELQANWGVMGAEALLNAMKSKMTDGEYAEWSSIVSTVNGYDKNMKELMEEAKN